MTVKLPGFLKTLIRYGLFISGVYLGVTIIIDIDVSSSLTTIDPADPNTWPEMAPQVRYFLIPVIGTIFAVVAVFLNAIIGLFHPRDFHWAVWPILGAAYSFMLSAVRFLRHSVETPKIGEATTLLVAVLAVVAIRIFFGKKKANGG